eukprot:2409474-Pleurochrysis_carterae.AAC.1
MLLLRVRTEENLKNHTKLAYACGSVEHPRSQLQEDCVSGEQGSRDNRSLHGQIPAANIKQFFNRKDAPIRYKAYCDDNLYGIVGQRLPTFLSAYRVYTVQ